MEGKITKATQSLYDVSLIGIFSRLLSAKGRIFLVLRKKRYVLY